jgi:hypothetical protein
MDSLKNIMIAGLGVILWVVLVVWILPRLGVPT